MNRLFTRAPRGMVAVEAALLFPVLLMITLGVFEYGWMILKSHQLTNIARQGARLVVLPDMTQSAVTLEIQQELTAAGLSAVAPSYATSTISGTPQQLIEVSLAVPYPLLTHFPLLPVPATLYASVAMTRETP